MESRCLNRWIGTDLLPQKFGVTLSSGCSSLKMPMNIYPAQVCSVPSSDPGNRLQYGTQLFWLGHFWKCLMSEEIPMVGGVDDRHCEPGRCSPHRGTETCSDGNKPDDGCPGKAKQPKYRTRFHKGIVKQSKLSTEGFVCYSPYN